jgi:ribosomal protein S18 acetylase RimI-like enzyme
MADSITIRRALPTEADAVLALMRRAFGEYRGRLHPESSVFVETVPVIEKKLLAGGGFVATHGDALVGCVIAEDLGDRGYLGRLAVDPAFRRMGLAGRLVAAAETFIRGRGRRRIELNVRLGLAGNIALFQRLGYRETARAAHPGWSEATYLVMEKSLE